MNTLKDIQKVLNYHADEFRVLSTPAQTALAKIKSDVDKAVFWEALDLKTPERPAKKKKKVSKKK